MFAGHLAAGLALRGRSRRVPIAAFLVGAFVLDLLWILFGVLRVDRTPWDDWSHSLLMATVWASAFALCFLRFGRMAIAAIWLAVFSHYVLDLLVQGASLYPGQAKEDIVPVLVSGHARLFQLALSALLLLVFVYDERGVGTQPWRYWSVAALVIALNGRFLLGV